MSGLPIRAKYRHFRTICEQTFDNSPTNPNSSSFMTWSCNFVQWLSFLFASSQCRSTHFFAWPSMWWDHEEIFASDFLETRCFSTAPAEILDSNKSLWLSTISLLVLHSRWVQTKINMVKEWCSFSKIQRLSWIFSTLDRDFFPAILISSTCMDIFFQVTKKNSKFATVSQPCSTELSRIAFRIMVLPKDDRTDFVQKERLDLPYWTMI